MYKCENCGHYQFDTTFGDCEECSSDSLIEISKIEYEKGIMKELKQEGK